MISRVLPLFCLLSLAALLLSSTVTAPHASAQSAMQELIDPIQGDISFGSAMQIVGDTAVIGIPTPYSTLTNSAAYIYTRQNGQWYQTQKLEPETLQTGFAEAIAFDGVTLAISAPGEGSTYIYTQVAGSWQYATTLTLTSCNVYGSHLALSGDTLLLSFEESSCASAPHVWVYVHTADGWTLQTTFSGDVDDAYFAVGGIALNGNVAVVGSPGYGFKVGAAYVFERTGTAWTKTQKLQPPSTGDGQVVVNAFGLDVATDGKTIIVGAVPGFSSNPRGHIHVFTRDDSGWWNEIQEATPSEAADNEPVANKLAFDGQTLVVSGGWGSVYVYEPDGSLWAEQPPLHSSSSAPNTSLGRVVALGGSTIMVTGYDGNQAAVWVFDHTPPQTVTVQLRMATDEALSLGPGATADATVTLINRSQATVLRGSRIRVVADGLHSDPAQVVWSGGATAVPTSLFSATLDADLPKGALRTLRLTFPITNLLSDNGKKITFRAAISTAHSHSTSNSLSPILSQTGEERSGSRGGVQNLLVKDGLHIKGGFFAPNEPLQMIYTLATTQVSRTFRADSRGAFRTLLPSGAHNVTIYGESSDVRGTIRPMNP